MQIPEVGEPAPGFTLPGTTVRGGARTDGEYVLSAEIGRTVVLAFYPGYATPVCTAQLCSYQEELDEAYRLITERDGHRRVLLSGHSTGGLIGSLWLAARRR